MSIRLMSRVWDFECESPTQKLILLALADNASDHGKCWPSIPTIARKTQLSERSVFQQISRLSELKWVSVESGGGALSNRYQLSIPPEPRSPLNHVHPSPECHSPPPLNVVQGTPERRAGKPSENRKEEPSLQPDERLILRSHLNILFKRNGEARWGCEEEQLLVDLSLRNECISELKEIEAFFERGSYRPQKLLSLLRDWPGALDRARNWEENRKRNEPQKEKPKMSLADKELLDECKRAERACAND